MERTIKIKRFSFLKEEKELLKSSYARKITGEVIPEMQKVIVRCGVRTVGAFTFKVEKSVCEISSYRVIEEEWNPLIVAIDTLAKYLKENNKKTTTLIWIM